MNVLLAGHEVDAVDLPVRHVPDGAFQIDADHVGSPRDLRFRKGGVRGPGPIRGRPGPHDATAGQGEPAPPRRHDQAQASAPGFSRGTPRISTTIGVLPGVFAAVATTRRYRFDPR